MKKLPIVLVMILLIFSLAGCGSKENAEQNAGEKIAEEALEKAIGDGNTEVDIDGETMTITDQEGETMTFGGTKWPDIDYLPEFKQGQIISATNDGQGNVMIIIEKVNEQDYQDYLANLKKDFTEETNEMQMEEYLLFEGKNAAGELVAVQYYINDNSLTVIGNRDSK